MEKTRGGDRGRLEPIKGGACTFTASSGNVASVVKAGVKAPNGCGIRIGTAVACGVIEL